ncbi:C4-dicarboxylate TRAP transporter large permease protein [Desulfonema limicola]|uniref:C4-dicarboxylate TRAP transporter large permease protein n=1 Tax=Desulfonema limicola TaxID=45656 RepID=A0A975GGB9_9BACT|nr:TRAP transporter large permease [Desulfonema limicola]QTA80099.1 C4-dicarboxylate TRAP transporter large permease protein [Desulfonema limicola]
MSANMAGLIGIMILLVFILARMNIGISMGLVGFLGFAYVAGFTPALGVLKTVPYTTFSEHGLSVIPLFLLMGAFAFHSGMSEDLFDAVYKWLGHFRGGVAMATIVACACFAAISGSSLATAATLGAIALPEMKKYKYDDGLATGAVAAGGSVGILIPPSVILIIYGIITEQSIGKLFLAGFIPGIMEAVFYIFTIGYLTYFKPEHGPRGPKTTFKEKLKSLKKAWEVFFLFFLVIGGIYKGIFTPTEAAGVGAFGTFFFSLVKGKMTWKNLKESLSSTVETTGMLFLVILGAMIFGYFLSVTRLPMEFASTVAGLPVNRYVVLGFILLIVLFLGCVMDSMAIVLLTIPVFYPLILKLNFDPIWFGILVVRVTEMGLITPPVGLNVFIIKGISGVPIGTIFRGVIPHLIADFIQVLVLIMFPQIVLWLPSLMD